MFINQASKFLFVKSMWHSTNEINRKMFNTYHKKIPKAPIRGNANRHNNVNKKRVVVIGVSMVKFVKYENLSDENYVANIQTNPGCTTEDIADHIKPIIRRKRDIRLQSWSIFWNFTIF